MNNDFDYIKTLSTMTFHKSEHAHAHTHTLISICTPTGTETRLHNISSNTYADMLSQRLLRSNNIVILKLEDKAYSIATVLLI